MESRRYRELSTKLIDISVALTIGRRIGEDIAMYYCNYF